MKQLDISLLGIDGRDFRIYKTLLQSGPSSIRAIAQASGINRGSVYESLKKLSAIGLIGYQQQTAKTKKYVAEPPERFDGLIAEKELELKGLQTDIIPHLRALSHIEPDGFSLPSRIYEDNEGIAAILRDVLATVESLDVKQYRAISSQQMRQYMYKRFPNFTKQRLAKKLFVKVLAIGGGGETTEFSERRWLSAQDDKQQEKMAYTIIYGTKLAIISITELNVPHGIVIDDPAIASMQAFLFDQLWSQAR